MHWKTLVHAALAAFFIVSRSDLRAQEARVPPSPHVAPADQVVAIRAGRLFDAKTATMLTNQVILVKGDRIADIGPSVQIPAGTNVIDLSAATVMPGLIDHHVHLIGGEGSIAKRTMSAVEAGQYGLRAGFTTLVDMNNRDNYATVDLRNMINKGSVQGPRLQVAGPALTPRASTAVTAPEKDQMMPDPYGLWEVHSPWLARRAVRQRKWYGTDWIKIYGTSDFVGAELWEFKPDNHMVNTPPLTREEYVAAVDEAHRQGLKVACHAYGGEGLKSCLAAGVDLPMHMPELDDDDLKLLVEKKLPLMFTIDDLVYLEPTDLRITAGKNSRLRMTEQIFKKTMSAGVPSPFGSGTLAHDGLAGGPEYMKIGMEADQFPYFVKWGASPAYALQMAMTVAANTLNYNWNDRVGSLEKGKYADIIAVAGDPLKDITEMQRVKFVMKGGVLIKNELPRTPGASTSAR